MTPHTSKLSEKACRHRHRKWPTQTDMCTQKLTKLWGDGVRLKAGRGDASSGGRVGGHVPWGGGEGGVQEGVGSAGGVQGGGKGVGRGLAEVTLQQLAAVVHGVRHHHALAGHQRIFGTPERNANGYNWWPDTSAPWNPLPHISLWHTNMARFAGFYYLQESLTIDNCLKERCTWKTTLISVSDLGM